MISKVKRLAIIPARGGSKRIPRKNIRDFCGYPVIKYSIDAAIESTCFDEIMVSTDDDEIKDISEKYGAKVPFKRSAKNSSDFASTGDVLIEVLDAYDKLGKDFDYLCCIYPAAPLVNAEKIRNGFESLVKSKADSLISVVRFNYPVQRALVMMDGKLGMEKPEFLKSRSQDLPERYHDAGQFYWSSCNKFLLKKTFLMRNTIAMELSELEVQDIDNEADWKAAEYKYRYLKNSNLL